jgi:hypothetical protein
MGNTKTVSSEKSYLKELWEVFEKTGSIGAYILYVDAKKRSLRSKKLKVRR